MPEFNISNVCLNSVFEWLQKQKKKNKKKKKIIYYGELL